ncbi:MULTISPECIES: 3-oxoacyl-ACP synthase III family protein [Streptomyces]|uniref:Ketoacyl-ACP synthase III n=2 Tax=Streptomyces TaxID=1883 RepID=A0A3R7IWY7_9ACTN|nr:MULTISPECIES: ketoacyl-ACP synthase III [Streptomyces]KNE81005.1 3-oxoacyl-ACP synthase [Streptomyces fradiae]OFA49719.1 3-oxoacyl-ACP synthase [Streptomyces fradiae]PQM19835.1 ketoacyl-ACP synthase III [Streptomyces xinghaiensis]RKM90884.1 ketoacyl-ACP synthase III [Streptomyces xinghaiensis]RNC68800.1 ketoacyl-ACP synthase III [Streptomyces xinghaiensis]
MTSRAAASSAEGAVGVLGTGSCLPGNVVTNEEVGAPAGVTDEWIVQRTGIRERRWAKPDEVTSGLAATAARTALADARVRAEDISLIIVATSTPDSPQPPTATAVALELGVPAGTPSFDMNAVCSGFVFALATAERMLHGTTGHALVIGADVYSRTLKPTDRRTVVLFGDGAGAVVLGPARGRGLFATRLATFPDQRDLIRVPAGGSRIPASPESLAEGLHYFTMDGRAVRAFVESRVGPMIRDFLDEHRLRASGGGPRTHLVPHQANGRMIGTLAADLGFPAARTHTTVREYGNTGAASVPLTLDHATGGLAPGDLVLLAGFGGGMAAGLALLEWEPPARDPGPDASRPVG